MCPGQKKLYRYESEKYLTPMLDLDINETVGMNPDKIATQWSSDCGILPWKVYKRGFETCQREQNWVKHMLILWVRTLDTSGTKQKPDRTLYFMGVCSLISK